MITARTTAPLLATAALLVLASTGGCFSSCYVLQSDPEGLPCAEDDPNDPDDLVCLPGYACVDDVCRKVGSKLKGEACVDDAQCGEGLVCRDVYDEDACGGDMNCALGRERDPQPGRLCRPVCDPDEPSSDQCAPGEDCFFDVQGAVRGFCQSGTCATDSDCGNNVSFANVCVGADNPPGLSGRCVAGCDPLDCNPNGTCATCPATDFDEDGTPDAQSCEPVEGTLQQLRLGCLPAGNVPPGGVCDANAFCAPGSFCLNGFCSRWCNTGGGAPACDFPQACNPVSGAIGFCQ